MLQILELESPSNSCYHDVLFDDPPSRAVFRGGAATLAPSATPPTLCGTTPGYHTRLLCTCQSMVGFSLGAVDFFSGRSRSRVLFPQYVPLSPFKPSC